LTTWQFSHIFMFVPDSVQYETGNSRPTMYSGSIRFFAWNDFKNNLFCNAKLNT
jgi:hypothetical protein